MSKVLECNESNDCRPWHPPHLDISEEVVFDYKLTDPEYLTHREQQQKIRQQAYEKSYARGYMEGLNQGQKEMGEQLQYLNNIVASLSMPLAEADGQVVGELVQLSMLVTKQLIRRELKTSPDEIVSLIRDTLALLPSTASTISLEVHPQDAELIRNTVLQNDVQVDWTIIENPLITRGGCQVISSSSRIDVTVEKRINEMIANVLGDDRKAEQS